MGYSRSKSAIERVKPILEILLTSEVDVEFPSANPYKLVYYLRDGFSVAKRLPSSPYKELHEKWRLRAKMDRVIAELKGAPVDIGIPILAKRFTGLNLPEVTEVLEIIGAFIKHKAPRGEFTNAHITGNGLNNLKKWCDNNNYAIIQSEPHLIIERNDRTDSTQDGGA